MKFVSKFIYSLGWFQMKRLDLTTQIQAVSGAGWQPSCVVLAMSLQHRNASTRQNNQEVHFQSCPYRENA
jgi:hypothetical protein